MPVQQTDAAPLVSNNFRDMVTGQQDRVPPEMRDRQSDLDNATHMLARYLASTAPQEPN
jgi:hypothetical protein